MATQSSDDAVLHEFPQFKELPIEIRRMIWDFALHILHKPQFIPLSFSEPNQPWTQEDYYNRPLTPWRQMFFSARLSATLLLHACLESRQAAKAFYTQSWATKADGWGYSPMTDTNDKLTDCNISEDFDKSSRQLYWKPETDVVLFKHQKEPYACELSICNPEGPSYGFWFDERIRFVAMPRDVFECGILYGGNLRIPNLEVAFVLVERPLKIRMLSESGISRKRIERRFRRWKDRKEQKWSDPRFVARIFPHPERKEDMGRIKLKIVTSLDEVRQIVAEWPPRVPQV
ncbi:hypothetical protein V8E51_009475 [Hyaloscypha variabilis]